MRYRQLIPYFLLFCVACEGGFQLDHGVDGDHVDDSTSPAKENPQIGEPAPQDEDAVLEVCENRDARSKTPLRRLTSDEFRSAVNHLVGTKVQVDHILNLYPADVVRADVATDFNPSVADDHVRATHQLAITVGRAIVESDAVAESFSGSCGYTESCTKAFINTFGATAFRRPLTENEIDAVWAVAEAQQGRSRIAVAVMYLLQSADFVMVFETGLDAVEGIVELTAHEIAVRIAFRTTGELPDAELVEAADVGELSDLSQIEAQVVRLMETDAFQNRLDDMWQYYLGHTTMRSLSRNQDFLAGLENEGLLHEMEAELSWFFHTLFWDDADFAALFTDTQVFPTSEALAAIYDAPVGIVTERDRPGFITRAGYLAQNGDNTSPILRGTEIVKRVLCRDIEVPNDDTISDELANIETDPSYHSSREKWEVSTAGGRCASCHIQINGFGFVMDEYDSLGRFRTEEVIFAEDGSVVATYPLNTTANVVIGDDLFEIGSTSELSEILSNRKEASACFAKRMTEYIQLRTLGEADACVIADVKSELQNRSLKQAMILAIANENIFWRQVESE